LDENALNVLLTGLIKNIANRNEKGRCWQHENLLPLARRGTVPVQYL
jgi:hypothetical protein